MFVKLGPTSAHVWVAFAWRGGGARVGAEVPDESSLSKQRKRLRTRASASPPMLRSGGATQGIPFPPRQSQCSVCGGSVPLGPGLSDDVEKDSGCR